MHLLDSIMLHTILRQPLCLDEQSTHLRFLSLEGIKLPTPVRHLHHMDFPKNAVWLHPSLCLLELLSIPLCLRIEKGSRTRSPHSFRILPMVHLRSSTGRCSRMTSTWLFDRPRGSSTRNFFLFIFIYLLPVYIRHIKPHKSIRSQCTTILHTTNVFTFMYLYDKGKA